MKFSIYNNEFKVGRSVYLYNTWTTKCLRFKLKEEKFLLEELKKSKKLTKKNPLVKLLYDEGFVVDDETKEFEIAKQWIEKSYESDKTLQIFLYVTNQCNFRCIYCPEPHVSERFSAKNWDALYKLAYDHVKNKGCNSIQIYFFGGEPLLEYRAIIKFLRDLNYLKILKPNLRLSHHITTNAYLLLPEIYNNLVFYNVRTFQITVDGMAETHNKNRYLVNGKGTWNKIIENLEYINSKNDVTFVHLRANINQNNMDSVERFFAWFDKNFKNKKFSYSFCPIGVYTNLVNKDLTIDSTSDDFRAFSNKLRKKYKKALVHSDYKLLYSRLGFACKVARKYNYVITANGKISKCEVAYAERYKPIGDLKETGEIIYTGDLSPFENYETDDCETCSYYPLCGARCCPEKWAITGKHEVECMRKNGKWVFVRDNIKYYSCTDIHDLLEKCREKEK